MFDVNVGAQGRRGVVVFVHTSLEKSVSSIEIVSEYEETLLLSLKLRAGDCLLFGVFYRSPSSSESNNLALNTILSTLCVQESPKYSHLCVVGDFNFPGINWSAVHTCQEGSMEDKFIETMENCFLHQHILSPTRCRGNTTPHILDLVLSNEEEMVSEIKHLSPLGSSDHQVISFKYSFYADWSKSQHKFNYGKGDFVGARLYLDEHPIRVDGDVDSMWESFKKSVIEVHDRHIPLMRIGARKWKSEYPADMGIMQFDQGKDKKRFQRLPPARGGTAQKKIIHLANWSQLIHPGPASSLTKFFLVSSQSCVSTLTHYSSELLLPRHQGL